MECKKVVQIRDLNPAKALESLNRMTGLQWGDHPISLLPNGLVLNGTQSQRENYFQEKRRA